MSIDRKGKGSSALRGITAELNGVLNYKGEEIFDYSATSKSFGGRLKSRGKGEFLANVIDQLDLSRNEYGTTTWQGRVSETEDGSNIRFVIGYDSVRDESKLPPRSVFLDSWGEDPYNILTEPMELMIEGEIDIAYEAAKQI